MIVVTTTAPDRPTADRLARALVDRRLAACVQVSGPITSTYRWQGAVETSEEWRVDAKTQAGRFDAVAEAIHELHPYDTPEIIATPITHAASDYADWLMAHSGGEVG